MEKNASFSKSSLIKLGDLASELGDVALAIDSYSKALNRIGTFNGAFLNNKKSIDSIMDKIEKLNVRESNAIPILYDKTWKLSKSSFVKGTQCTKYLFLDTYKREEKTLPSKEKMLLFDKGHRFEDMFREKMFPGGVNVKEAVGVTAYYMSYTNYLMSQESVSTIYEATIIENDVLVMCDVLAKDANGMIDIYECKMSLNAHKGIKNDLAIQYMVCKKRFGKKLKSFNLVLATSDGGWKIEDYKPELDKTLAGTKKLTEKFKDVLANVEPEIEMGNHCDKPYKCEFVEYCLRNKN